MKPPRMDYKLPDTWEEALKVGQGVMELKL